MYKRSVVIFSSAALACVFFVCGFVRLRAASPSAPQSKKTVSPQAWLRGVSDGSTRVVDMTYAINGKLPAWPGDDRTFEAKVVATPEALSSAPLLMESPFTGGVLNASLVAATAVMI